MANLVEVTSYDAGVYQIELTDPVQGGPTGVTNVPLKSLANRTNYLKKHLDDIESGATVPNGLAVLNSPAFTGTPTSPTAPLGDASQKIASTDFVQKSLGGILSKNVAGGSNVSLTAVEAGNGILVFTGAITSSIAVIVPAASRSWVVANRTTGDFGLSVKTPAGTGVPIPQGLAVVVFCDGTNVYLASSAGQSSMTPYSVSPAAGTTSIPVPSGYTPGSVLVEKNGAMLRPADYNASSGTTIGVPATVAGDQFTIYAFSSFSVANAVQKSGDVMAGALALFAGSTAPNQAAGTRGTAVATMNSFASEFVANLSGSGYQKLPSGLIIQWASVALPSAANTSTTVAWPIQFPSAILAAAFTPDCNSAASFSLSLVDRTASGIKLLCNAYPSGGWGSAGLNVIVAIGY